jgi:uncharacterized protein YuzE
MMVFQYFADTDMLYIQLADHVSTEAQEIVPGVVVDLDAESRIVGIEIEDASKTIDLSRLELTAMPLANLILNRELPVAA